MIPFNKPYLQGRELEYIAQAVKSGKISGDGVFTKKCVQYFCENYYFKKTLLTTSCTDALEMAALLLDIKPGDEVIIPSFTFVSTANAFVLRGAKIIFADSQAENPNIDPKHVAALISSRTKAIVVVHYAGVACDMDEIMALASANSIIVVEDAAQAIDSFYKGVPLGSIGALGAFSFHETKNIISGEGGMLIVNDQRYQRRAEIIREKGTNRSAFFRGEVDKYGWVDIGSSFLPSDIIAAYLFAQLENLRMIQERRIEIVARYRNCLEGFAKEGRFSIANLPSYATENGHMFYLICESNEVRSALLSELKKKGIHAVFHYLPLHTSPYFSKFYRGESLPRADHFSDCLVRLPLFYELTDEEVDYICECVSAFFQHEKIPCAG